MVYLFSKVSLTASDKLFDKEISVLLQSLFICLGCYKFNMEEYKYTKVQNKYERSSSPGSHFLQIFEVLKNLPLEILFHFMSYK